MKFIVLQRDDIENFIHIEHPQVHDLINEAQHNELAQILNYEKYGDKLLLPKGLRLLYIPPLEELGITTGETSITLEWTGLEEDTLYLIKDDVPLKLRITNPKAGVYYKTL